MRYIDILGFAATAVILLSFLFKGPITIRIINSIGAAVFIVYGAMVSVWPVVALNAALILVHLFYLIKSSFDKKKEKEEKADEARNEEEKKTKSWWERRYASCVVMYILAMSICAVGLTFKGGVIASAIDNNAKVSATSTLNIGIYAAMGVLTVIFAVISVLFIARRKKS